MSNKKNKKELIENDAPEEFFENVVAEPVEDEPLFTEEEPEQDQPVEPEDPKKAIMEEFAAFYTAEVKGHSVVSSAVGRKIVGLFNAYADKRVKYTGCSSCVVTKISWMRKQAKEKYNIEF